MRWSDGCESSKKLVRLILFFVFFRKGWWLSSIKAGKKEIRCGIREQGGGGVVFMTIAGNTMPKEETSNVRKGECPEWLAVGNSSCSLATPCAEGRVIAGCWFVK